MQVCYRRIGQLDACSRAKSLKHKREQLVLLESLPHGCNSTCGCRAEGTGLAPMLAVRNTLQRRRMHLSPSANGPDRGHA